MPRTLIYLNFDPMGISRARKLKMKHQQISYFHHYIHGRKFLDDMNKSKMWVPFFWFNMQASFVSLQIINSPLFWLWGLRSLYFLVIFVLKHFRLLIILSSLRPWMKIPGRHEQVFYGRNLTKSDTVISYEFVRLQEMDSQSYRKAAALSIMCYSVL